MAPRFAYTEPLADERLESFVRTLPKAELHLHLEGAYRWETIRQHHPRGRHLPETPPWWRPGGTFATFGDFLQVFLDYVRPATGTPEAIAQHIHDVVADLVAQNVRYAEILASPVSHCELGLSHREVVQTMERALDAATTDQPIVVRFIYGLLGRRDPALVLGELREAAKLVGLGSEGLFAGVDLMDSGEPEAVAGFARVFRFAADSGARVRAHVGEVAGPDGIRVAVEQHGIRHLSHGVRVLEDDALTDELCQREVWFHTCPTSNVKLRVAASYAEHPIRELVRRGARVTVSSDDPLLFGATLVDEYRELIRSIGFQPATVVGLARAGFEAALLSPRARTALGEEMRAFDGI